MNFEPKHWALIGAMLVALGTQLAGVKHGWADVADPIFIGGVFLQIGTTITALYVGAPKKPYDGVDRRSPTGETP
jgi:hypothetical protein